MAGASSSSGGSRKFKYDVFINFRGEDTRRCFVCHLYNTLEQKALDTFIDSEKLHKGDDLSELLEAIKGSRLSIVVFSKDYASSTWCLKELVQILECKDQQDQIVVPVFYEVDPSQIRKFEEAFAKHESNPKVDNKEVKSWKSALARATKLSGYCSTSAEYPDHYKLIETIVNDTLNTLNRISPSITDDGLIGMDFHMEKIDSLLNVGVDDCRIVGIWGMGGIGKSTIAEAVYEKLKPQFEHKCFLANVKEDFTKSGKEQMFKNLVCTILKIKDQHTLDGCRNEMRKRLGEKKVLLVLDDVDNKDQIDTLIGENPSFGGGSRVIITTRDKRLLPDQDLIYEPELFTPEKSLELLRRHAFRTIKYSQSYDAILRSVVEYAQGLPLALKVLGGLLDNKTVQQWEYELEKIKKIPMTDIGRVLRASYDGLDHCQKNIFLDIACFFRGRWKDDVLEFHDSCGYFPKNGLTVLEERSLLTVSKYGLIEMHDLIQEMGRDIVRQESTDKPGKRSRLWDHEDVVKVLAKNKKSNKVQGVLLDFSKLNEVCVNKAALAGLKGLRMLRLSGKTNEWSTSTYRDCTQCVTGSGDLKFSSELRVLVWEGYPLESLPSDMSTKNLIEIDMNHSKLKQLWKETKSLQNLVHMDLSYSVDLISTPDFSDAKKLKWLKLVGCSSLLEVDPSISALESISYLNLVGCTNLGKFPNISGNMKELRRLYLKGCAITEVPSSVNDLPELETLSLHDCKELRSLPSSIHMKSLQELDLSGCSKLAEFPEISQVMEKLIELRLDDTAIEKLPSSIINFTSLNTLTMRRCRSLVCLPEEICNVAYLENLDLTGCSKLAEFPEISQVMENLRELCLNGTAIKELPSSIDNLTNLRKLRMRNCTGFVCLPEEIYNLAYLEDLDLTGCSKLAEFPEISQVMQNLTELCLDGTAIEKLPSSIINFTNLEELSLSGCRSLVCLPEEICNLACLENLDLTGCSKLAEFPEISQVMKRLTRLILDDTAIEKLPSSIINLTNLEELSLSGCRSLVCLPDEICNLAFLRDLDLTGYYSRIKNFAAGSGIKQRLPMWILLVESVSFGGCKEMTAPFSSWPTLNHQIPSGSVLSDLDLSDCNLLELSDAIAHLSSLKYLNLSGNKNLESLPAAMNRLLHLSSLGVEGCMKLKSIPELSSSVQHICADDCTSLETVSVPCNDDICLSFANCLRLQATTSLFIDTVETTIVNQVEASDYESCGHMFLPGSIIPDWFYYQSRGSSVTVKLPLDWSTDEFQGLAICAISNSWGAQTRKIFESAYYCWGTFKANDGHQDMFYSEIWGYVTDTPLESDHMFLAYLNSSNLKMMNSETAGKNYTEATFRIVQNDYWCFDSMISEDCSWITSCGVRLFHMDAPFSVDLLSNLETRETEIRSKRKRESLERGKEKMGMEVQEETEECSGGPKCCCFSLSGCTILSTKRRKEREIGGVAKATRSESEKADFSGEGDLSREYLS